MEEEGKVASVTFGSCPVCGVKIATTLAELEPASHDALQAAVEKEEPGAVLVQGEFHAGPPIVVVIVCPRCETPQAFEPPPASD